MPDVWGYADLHCHPLAHLGFGGANIAPNGPRLFWGRPDDGTSSLNPDAALPCCDPAHGFLSNPSLLSIIIEGHSNHGCGAPDYENWPRYNTILHQQMFVSWMRRAFDSGLRLICALAVHNRLLARLFGDLGDVLLLGLGGVDDLFHLAERELGGGADQL